MEDPSVPAIEPIKIGDINSITGEPEYAAAYYMGAQLAVEQINNAGGIRGQKLKIVRRDDQGDPANAVKAATDLLDREKVVLLAGTWFDNVGLAVSNLAKQRQVLYIKTGDGTDEHIWQQGHRYAFRIFSTNRVLASALAEEAAKLNKERWALVAPHYEYGYNIVKNFKQELKVRQPNVKFVEEQYPAMGKTDGNLIVRVLDASNPDAVFNALFGSDIGAFGRAGNKVGFFDRVSVVGAYSGIAEEMRNLGAELPKGWITNGYAPDDIQSPAHIKFVAAFKSKYGDAEPVKFGTLSGYITYQIIGQMLAATSTTDTDDMIETLHREAFDTVLGPVQFRKIDNQSTVGVWIGKTDVIDGQPKFVDWKYIDGEYFMPSDDWIRSVRPQD
ncbi:MAG: ABC transporter substrate-binding protein [Gammaproteobacteria bacterium]|nr:ABC transporter substrate-binding protein [Gammaproteobacteria bacterium]